MDGMGHLAVCMLFLVSGFGLCLGPLGREAADREVLIWDRWMFTCSQSNGGIGLSPLLIAALRDTGLLFIIPDHVLHV